MRVDRCAAIVWEHWCDGTTFAALPDAARPRTLEEGYAVQQALAAVAGEVAGWKIAATSPAGQAHIRVDRPIPGRIFARFLVESGATVPGTGLNMAVAEAEFAFRMGARIPAATAATLTRDEILERVSDLHLAIELPESRFDDFATAGLEQLLADDACAGRFVLGAAVPGWRELDLRRARTRLSIDGACVAEGTGANVLGDPVTALQWLVTELGAHGIALQPGDLVTTGTTTVPAPIGRGDRIHAEFEALGAVEVRVGDG